MVTSSEYLQIIKRLSNVAVPDELLERIKTKYSHEIASPRAMEKCRSMKDLIKLLEKRNIVYEDNIDVLKHLAAVLNSTYIIQSSNEPQRIQVIAPMPTNVYDKITFVVGRDIGYKWKDFARALHIREGEIDNLEMKYKDVPERVREILNAYREMTPRNYFRTNLLDALCEARRKDLSYAIANIMDNSNMAF